MNPLAQNPLILFEIIALVGRFLAPSEVAKAMRVCETWHSALKSSLWHTLHTKSTHFGRPRELSKDDLQQLEENAHFVRVLVCTRQVFHSQGAPHKFTALELSLLCCRRLRWLETGVLSLHTIDVLRNNQHTLQRFNCTSSLYLPEELARTRTLWSILPTMTCLTHLTLHWVTIEAENVHLFEKACLHLKALSLTSCAVAQMPIPAKHAFTAMRSVSLTNVYGYVQDHLQLISQCTRLTNLSWRTLSKTLPALELRSFLSQSRSTSSLSSLTLSHSHIPDHELAAMISVMPHTISCLDFASSFFGYESARATGTKLKDNPPLSLDIRSCLYATSNVVQDLLSSCYNLNRLRADCIDAGDMGTGPWVCLEITELDLTLCLHQQASVPIQVDCRVAYLQLSRLTKLHVLRLGKHASGHSAEDGPNAYIDFTLAQGLGNLASLEELRDLDLTRMHPRMGVEEAIWIQGHWPRLRRLSGIFHPDETIAVQMVEYLRKGRPDVVIVA